jgi:hypothetical protein
MTASAILLAPSSGFLMGNSRAGEDGSTFFAWVWKVYGSNHFMPLFATSPRASNAADYELVGDAGALKLRGVESVFVLPSHESSCASSVVPESRPVLSRAIAAPCGYR